MGDGSRESKAGRLEEKLRDSDKVTGLATPTKLVVENDRGWILDCRCLPKFASRGGIYRFVAKEGEGESEG